MGGVLLAAIPAVLVAGALTVLLSAPVVRALSERTGDRADPQTASAVTATLVCVLALVAALGAWHSPALVVFGSSVSDRWGLCMDGLAGPVLAAMLALFAVACATGLLRGTSHAVPFPLLLALAAAGTLLVLAQNPLMLALAIEAAVALGALLVARGGPQQASGPSTPLRYLAVSQVGALLLVIVLVRLSSLAHAPVAGLPELPLYELGDLRARVSMGGPHVLGTLAALWVLGFVAWAGAANPWVLPDAARRYSSPVLVSIAGGLFAAQGMVFIRVALSVFPYECWESASAVTRSLAVVLAVAGAAGALWARRPGSAFAWALLSHVGVLALAVQLGDRPGAAGVAFALIGLAAARAGLAASASEGPWCFAAPSALTGGAAAALAGLTLVLGAAALPLASTGHGWRPGAVALAMLAVALAAYAVRWGLYCWHEWSRRAHGRIGLVAVCALTALAAVPLPGRDAVLRQIEATLSLERRIIAPPIHGGGGAGGPSAPGPGGVMGGPPPGLVAR